MQSQESQIGEWVNVMGYVQSQPLSKHPDDPVAKIQALVLWSAGSINLQNYERSLDSNNAEGSTSRA